MYALGWTGGPYSLIARFVAETPGFEEYVGYTRGFINRYDTMSRPVGSSDVPAVTWTYYSFADFPWVWVVRPDH